MSTVRLGLRAWLAGLAAYIAALGIIWGEWMSYGDFGAVAGSSLTAFALCYWLVYLPVLRLVRRILPLQTPWWPFALVGVLIGVVPTALIARYWGGSFRALITPEATLLLVLFTVVGLVVGSGFRRITRT